MRVQKKNHTPKGALKMAQMIKSRLHQKKKLQIIILPPVQKKQLNLQSVSLTKRRLYQKQTMIGQKP